jgi:hypothetical protein
MSKGSNGLAQERWKNHHREHRDLRRAVKLQAGEYERRLDELNHAHAEAKAKEAEYVTRDKFEDYIARADDARTTAFARMDERFTTMERTFNERVSSLNESRAVGAGHTSGLTLGWKLLIGVIGTVLLLLQIYSLVKR